MGRTIKAIESIRKGNRLTMQVILCIEFGIDGDQIVAPATLDAMA